LSVDWFVLWRSMILSAITVRFVCRLVRVVAVDDSVDHYCVRFVCRLVRVVVVDDSVDHYCVRFVSRLVRVAICYTVDN
jgi:hypothetical protein